MQTNAIAHVDEPCTARLNPVPTAVALGAAGQYYQMLLLADENSYTDIIKPDTLRYTSGLTSAQTTRGCILMVTKPLLIKRRLQFQPRHDELHVGQRRRRLGDRGDGLQQDRPREQGRMGAVSCRASAATPSRLPRPARAVCASVRPWCSRKPAPSPTSPTS